MKYHKSHSLKRTVLRWNWLIVPPIPVCEHKMLPPPGVLLQPTSILARSKCVPNKTEPAVVDEPVKNPFGLQTYRSSPINQPFDCLWALVPPSSAPLSF